MSRDRDTALVAKTDELKAELNRWARAEKMLMPGEVLVFSLGIESIDLVRVSSGAKDAIETIPATELVGELSIPMVLTPIQDRKKRAYICLQPANLDPAGVEEFLESVVKWRGSLTGRFLAKLLIDHENIPTRDQPKDDGNFFGYGDMENLNKKLRLHPIRGRFYRLIHNHLSKRTWYQLWEIRINK